MSTQQNQIYMCIFFSTLQMAIVIQQHIKPYMQYILAFVTKVKLFVFVSA